ncbi:transposase [Haloferax sulfurifontis]|uniref:Transposase (TCE33) n=2 Tax=Haloferax sulfurifontis TaxID=255616 RepID=M0IM97_9EURY|nr:transposase [Haloferax sulfurifontis]ELZ96569.1 transposase (TCE33) [Haloferax sulfurifontis ATCC BAA-897]GGC72794.1 hypothetical protein GCM10007209_38450 [Haloferax sulfurifontis]
MDKDANRDPETEGEINRRREERAEIGKGYRAARRKLPDSPADDPWGYMELPTRNPADYEIPPLWEALADSASRVRWRTERNSLTGEPGADIFDPIAATIGETRLFPHYWDKGDNADLTRNLDGEEATRVYLYMDLSPLPEYRVADRIGMARVRDALDIENSVSQSTLNRMPGRMDKERRYYLASETETLVRQWQDTKYEDWVRNPTPDTIAPDGEGVPPVQTLVRELRSETFKYIRLKRDASTSVSKDAAMRVLVAAANGNAFVNDAAENLDLKPWYDGSEIPTGQTLIYHIRKSTREQITQMFMEANEPLFEIAADHDYFPDRAEVAIDITDWPYYGDPDSDEYVRGTKPGRNYARAWKYITLSLVGTDTPFILLVLPVRKRSEAPQYVRRLLRFANQYLDLHRVYLDAGTEFYNSDTISTVNEFGLELVMQGRKSGSDIKHFLNGMGWLDMESSYIPYGVGDLDEDNYHAVGVKSEKKSKLRKSKPEKPMDDYTYFYTNIDPSEVPPEELASDYRRRWGIETGFRVLKEEFLSKSASPDSVVRTFYFNFAAHLYNIWTVANIRRADELDVDLSEGKQFTAGRLMQAIEDDPYDLDIPTEPPETRQVFGELF